VNLDAFLRERRERWAELAGLVRTAGRRPASLGPDGVRRLGALYRSAAADLALARRRFAGDPVVFQLADLVGKARPLVYDSDRRAGSVAEFVSRGYWRRVGERPVLLAVAATLLIGTSLLAGVWAWRDPGAALPVAPEEFRTWTEPVEDRPAPSTDESAAFAGRLFTNNIQVAILAFAAGIAAGLGAAFVLVFNGVVLGVVAGLAASAGNGRLLLEWIPAHGLLELSCIAVAGAAGMRMGWAIVSPGPRRRGAALAAEARPAAEIVLGTAAWLVVAGLLEGFVSPSDIGLTARVAVGLVAAGSFWGLVLWRGRPEPSAVSMSMSTSPATAVPAPSP
jgi:uncharacterized membrane protein SpoIIM required for sporulation